MKKTKKQQIEDLQQLIKDLQQQVHDLEVKLDTQNDKLKSSINLLIQDLEVRKFKEKAKGDKYIVKVETMPFSLQLQVTFLDDEEENVIMYKKDLSPFYLIDLKEFDYKVNKDYKVNEDYIELYVGNELTDVYKITYKELEKVGLELYKKAYPYSVNLKKNICECNAKIVDSMEKDREEKLEKIVKELKPKKPIAEKE